MADHHGNSYQVQKSRLIEKMAEMLQDKKLPMLADIRDESAEDIRIVLEPKSRRFDPETVIESLFKITDLETKISLNLNVLDSQGRPAVLSLREALNEWLAHRRVVLQRPVCLPAWQIAKRLEIRRLSCCLSKSDEVIAIIREEDEPKAELMRRFSLSENQANAIWICGCA